MTKHADAALVERNERIASMFRQGLTLATIGAEYGITRERVRQIIKAIGADPADGGQKKQTSINRAKRAGQLDAKYMAAYGLTHEEFKKLSKIGAVRAYQHHRKNSKNRGISFNFLLVDWWAVWSESGKYALRGRNRDGYVMSRIKDSGGYEVGNVNIKTLAENSREATKIWIGKVKQLPCGVFELYPGTNNPFLAKFGRKRIGFFKTPEEADAARKEYLDGRNEAARGFGSGRGWTYVKSRPTKPYRCKIAGMKSVDFHTQQEAEAYYRVTTAKILAERQVA